MDNFHKKKFIVKFFVVTNIFVLLLCFFLSWYEMRIKKIEISDIPELVQGDNVRFCIDKAKCKTDRYDGNLLEIEGWCVIVGKTTSPVAMHVLLKNEKTGLVLELPTCILKRGDVTEAINDGID